MRTLVLMLILAICVAGCSSTPSRAPNEQAISYALIEDVTLRTLTNDCSEVSVSARQAAWSGQRSWWKRNRNLVEAADAGMIANIVQVTGDRDETGALYAMSLTFEIVNQAEKNVAAMLAGQPSESSCVSLMATYKSGEKDLRHEKTHYPLLVSMQQDYDQSNDGRILKAAELQKKKGKKHARSAYIVERMMKREGCPKAAIKTLKADWPLEIFEAVCADDAYLLVRCEWGSCKVQQ